MSVDEFANHEFPSPVENAGDTADGTAFVALGGDLGFDGVAVECAVHA